MRQLGIIQILLSGFCFGFLGIFGKWAYSYGLSPGEYLSLRFLLASTLLGAWLLWREPAALRVSRAVLFRSLALGVMGYAVFSSCYFEALTGLSASLTVLLLYTYPVLVSLGAWILFRERFTRVHALALPLVMVGMVLLVWGEFQVRKPSALLFGFGSALFYALYILASRHWLKGVPALTSTFYIMLGAGITLAALHLRPGRIPVEQGAWLVILGTALISTLLAMSLFLAALQKLSSTEASLLSAAEPVTAIALAGFVLGESLIAQQWVGGLLILVGMVLVSGAGRKVTSLEEGP